MGFAEGVAEGSRGGCVAGFAEGVAEGVTEGVAEGAGFAVGGAACDPLGTMTFASEIPFAFVLITLYHSPVVARKNSFGTGTGTRSCKLCLLVWPASLITVTTLSSFFLWRDIFITRASTATFLSGENRVTSPPNAILFVVHL